jgi:hypothetical protein
MPADPKSFNANEEFVKVECTSIVDALGGDGVPREI